MAKVIIFDFDGTLADTLDMAIQFGNENQVRFSEHKISRDDFRNYSMREALKQIGLPLYKLPRFAFELKQYLRVNLPKVRLFPGVEEFILLLKAEGKDIYIMSSNSRENIVDVLNRNKLLENFTAIHSAASIFGKHIVLKKMLGKYGIDPRNALYIGDEVRDFEACKKAGVDMVSVSWGWDSADRLKQSGIQRVASDFLELKKMLL